MASPYSRYSNLLSSCYVPGTLLGAGDTKTATPGPTWRACGTVLHICTWWGRQRNQGLGPTRRATEICQAQGWACAPHRVPREGASEWVRGTGRVGVEGRAEQAPRPHAHVPRLWDLQGAAGCGRDGREVTRERCTGSPFYSGVPTLQLLTWDVEGPGWKQEAVRQIKGFCLVCPQVPKYVFSNNKLTSNLLKDRPHATPHSKLPSALCTGPLH